MRPAYTARFRSAWVRARIPKYTHTQREYINFKRKKLHDLRLSNNLLGKTIKA